MAGPSQDYEPDMEIVVIFILHVLGFSSLVLIIARKKLLELFRSHAAV
jgi:hypothetical protein